MADLYYAARILVIQVGKTLKTNTSLEFDFFEFLNSD